MIFKSSKQIENYLLERSKIALENMLKEVYDLIQKFLNQFYSDYTPIPGWYERTEQLLHSLVKGDIKKTGKGFTAYVYFDYARIKYDTGAKPSGKQVLEAAAEGKHGAKGLKTVDGRTGIDVWNTPLETLNDNAIQKFKEYLIQAGIPVK